ncbi:unnamed protein product [Protopolystoma xenopodis]|uniref:Uncharacterized protein n=1 Tax=Protopolystoma xenopodis TaxID=117903 RepID=A0A3S5B5P1_9PLAT|nr:unnamed protein product [Protopolystoma xenopodis]
MSGSLPSPRSDYGLRTRCIPQGFPVNMNKLGKQGKKTAKQAVCSNIFETDATDRYQLGKVLLLRIHAGWPSFLANQVNCTFVTAVYECLQVQTSANDLISASLQAIVDVDTQARLAELQPLWKEFGPSPYQDSAIFYTMPPWRLIYDQDEAWQDSLLFSRASSALPDVPIALGVDRDEALQLLAYNLPDPLSKVDPSTGLPTLTKEMGASNFTEVVQAFILPAKLVALDMLFDVIAYFYPDRDGADPRQRSLRQLTGSKRKLLRLERVAGDMDFVCTTLAFGEIMKRRESISYQ